MKASPQVNQVPFPGASFVNPPSCSTLGFILSDPPKFVGGESKDSRSLFEWLLVLLERLGTLLGLPVLVVLPPYVVTHVHLIRKNHRPVLVPVRVRR